MRYDESSSIAEVARVSRFNDPEVHVIPSHISLMRAETEFNNLRSSLTSLIKKLKPVEEKYDVVLIDTPPSFNLYAFIPLVSANYLIIPSDLKPFANQGLSNVKNYLHEEINSFKQMMSKAEIEILGVLPCKINPNSRFVKYTLPKQIQAVSQRYEISVMETVIFQREELAKCIDKTREVGDLLIPPTRGEGPNRLRTVATSCFGRQRLDHAQRKDEATIAATAPLFHYSHPRKPKTILFLRLDHPHCCEGCSWSKWD